MVGTQDGGFPPMGWHVPGEMGGLWAHPIKLLDGFWLRVDEELLARPGRFTTYPWGSELAYELPAAGLTVVRRQFVPDGEPALVVELELCARPGAVRTLTIGWVLCADLRPVWLGEQAGLAPGGSRAGFDPDLQALVVTDATRPWACLAGAAASPAAWRTGKAVRLPEPALAHNGLAVELIYEVVLSETGRTRLALTVAGCAEGRPAAVAAFCRVRSRHRRLLAAKQSRLQGLVRRAALSVPDPALTQLFDWAKINFDWLVRRVPGLGRSIGGGLPDYPWWFGCDTSYTAFGLLAAGQPDLALDSLRMLARLSDPATGRIIHEATTAGTVFNPGNAQETPHFIRAAWEAFCWTGDRPFLNEAYPLCRRGLLDWTLGDWDAPGDGLPAGGGIMEGTGLPVKAVDTAVHTITGLDALRRMAQVIGDREAVSRCRRWQSRLQAALEQFWLPAEGLYGDVLAAPAEMAAVLERWAAVAKDAAQQSHVRMLLNRVQAQPGGVERPWLVGNWVSACPLAAGLVPRARAKHALGRLESAEFSSPWGLRVNPYLEPNTMTISTAELVAAELAYGRSEQALALLRRMADALDYDMPGALGEFLPEGGCFVQAWSGSAVTWPLVGLLLGIRPLAHRKRVLWRPQLPPDWVVELQDLPVGEARMTFRAGGGRYEVSGTRPGWEVWLRAPGGVRRVLR